MAMASSGRTTCMGTVCGREAAARVRRGAGVSCGASIADSPSGVGAEGAAELHVLKQRDGAAGYVDLYFYEQWLRFEDLMEPGT